MIKRCLVAVLAIVTMIGIAQASPLEVNIEEKINTTATPTVDSNGIVTYSYSTDVKGLVTIKNNGSDILYDVWVALKLENTTGTCSLLTETATSNVYVYSGASAVPDKINKAGVFNTSDANCFVHIPILKPNEYAIIQYDVDESKIGDGRAPFIIDEKYNPAKIPARVPYTWKVTMNVTLNTDWFNNSALDLSGRNVNVEVIKYLSNDPSNYGDPSWVSLGPISHETSTKGSTSIDDGPYTSNTNDKLTVTGIQLNQSDKKVTIQFNVTGNYTNSTASQYYIAPFGFAVLSFNVDGNLSGSYVVDVFAVGNATINVTKYGPDENNYWYGNATIKNTASGLTYVLTNVTMWATPSGDFKTVISGSSYEWKPNVQLAPNEAWNTSQGNPAGINFSYNGVPIIWANATFKLIKNERSGWWFTGSETLNETNATYGSGFIVLEKIYVIGTYLIKVTKHVIWNDTAKAWDVYIVVENIGGEKSPSVWVYDMIPKNYSVVDDEDWSDSDDTSWVNKTEMLLNQGSTNDVPSDYEKGYWWQLNPLEPNSNGDGSYTDWDEISNNKSVVIHYQMNGTGEFHPIDAFVVGVDPMFSMNSQTAHKITIVSGAKAESYETLMALMTGIVGVGALVATRRR